MRERQPFEFFLIRYVPDVVKGEFANIGVVLREAAVGGAAAVRFTRDWRRVKCMDEDADTELLEALEEEIGARLRAGVSARDPKAVMEVLEDSLSNSVQMSPVNACLAENAAAEMDLLMRMYVETAKAPARVRAKTGRGAIVGSMRTEFERASVWGLMQKRIAASRYTRAGDPMRVDCGYRAAGDGGLIRMFQAVSLDGDVEAAKGLAYSSAALRDGVRRVEGAELELTAVVEPLREVSDVSQGNDERSERYRFGVDAMEREAIRVVTVNDLARVAQTARVELRV